MKKITTTLLAAIALILATKTNAQWNLAGNNNATATSVVGTTNAVPLRLATKNTPRLIIDTLGKVGIGTSSIPGMLTVKGSGGNPAAGWTIAGTPLFSGFGEQTVGNADYILNMASSLANSRPVFVGRRSRGTLAAPTSVSDNDYIMSFLSSAYDGTNFQNAATIDFYADGTPTKGGVPTRISFVTGSNSSNRTERLKVGSTGDFTFNNNQLFVQQSTGNVGVGNILPQAKMDINGNIKIADGSQGFGKILTSDSNGLASWKTPAATPAEIDPEVSSSATNKIPKWNGTTLTDGTIVDNGNVGIGEANPQGILHVSQITNFAGVTFNGTGLNDLVVDHTSYTLTTPTSYVIRVQDASADPNMIQLSNDGGVSFGVAIAISTNTITLAGQTKVTFDSTGGHTVGDQWEWTVNPNFKNMFIVRNGRVGIGTANPLARLHVADSSVVFTASGQAAANPANPPISGQGRRMMWYADKGAFRAGYVGSSNWDKDSIGNYSFACGSQTQAKGLGSTAMGGTTSASGVFSTAMGVLSIANGDFATAMGYGTKANSYASTVVGQFNDTTASSGTSSVSTDPAFIVGNGTALANRSSALTVLKNGNIGVGTVAPAFKLQVSTNSAAKPTSNTWTVASDARLKTNVSDYTEGLSTLEKIHPVWFTYNGKAGMPKETGVGVIAQELQKIAPYMVANWTYTDKESATSYLGVDNGAMTYMLINAVKELKLQSDDKDKTIADMQTRLARLETLLTNNSKTTATTNEQNVSFYSVLLSQNTPNPPVNNFTKINYEIPNGVSKAEMLITDQLGRSIKQIALNTFGKGTLNVDTKGLNYGTYNYTLLADGKMVDTKKMVVAK